MAPLDQLQPSFRSSGDLIADRRFNYACSYAQAGEFQAAAELLEQTIERAPGWPAAWFALGKACESGARRQAAIMAFAKATALDPSDELGAALHLARLGAALPPPPRPNPTCAGSLINMREPSTRISSRSCPIVRPACSRMRFAR